MKSEPEEKSCLSNFIGAENVLIIQEQITKERLIEKLVAVICQKNSNLNKDEILQKVLEREQGISTTLDTGISIPHARIEGIDNFDCAFAILPNDGLQDNGIEIKAMFLFISPCDPAFFKKHLALLASLSHTFQPKVIDEMMKMTDPKDVLEKITSQNHIK